MPNRILKESICTSKNLETVSADAQVLFFRLIVKVDDFGLFFGDARLIASLLYPLNPPKIDKVKNWLAELEQANLIKFYVVEDETYIQLITFQKHQIKRAARSKFPLPQ